MQERTRVKTTRSKLPPRGWMRARGRVKAYQAPPPSGFRRFLARVFNGWTISLALLVVLATFLTLTYYWFEFSDRIDNSLLSGQVFTPSAGIYSAPKTLKEGEDITLQGLVDYLKSAGYIDKAAKADATRSRFTVQGDSVIVEPGITGTIDGTQVFPDLLVKFKKDLKSVASIRELKTDADVKSARLEPRMLSTIAAEGDGRRKTVKFDDLPPNLVKAITVTEDRAFFDHYGVNFRGIARAAWRRYDDEDAGPLENQGGSSITQQLVKNLLLTKEPTLKRKITEAYMSVILETRLTKQEIFTLYSNQIYLGQQAGVSIYGVGEAANVYFGKDVSQLTLPESAFIAGIIRSPNRYGPYKNPEKVTDRRNQVLDSMLEAGEISQAQHAEATRTPLVLREISSRKDLQGMPYFSQYAIEKLPEIVSDPEALQHLRVYTSIDPDLQRIAYEIVAKRLDKLDKSFPKKAPGNLNAALVAIRPGSGEIVAMVGGRDYLQNQFNRATNAMRQPGSVFKPFVYASAINSAYEPASRVFTAASILKDEKKVFTYGNRSYAPNNYGDHFSGADITLRDALVKSKNTITVDLAMQLNIGRVMNLAAKAGLPKVERAYPSMALGTAEATPLQVATGYSIFANLGDRVDPRPITLVTQGDGSTVAAPEPEKKPVLRPEVSYILNDIMKDVINRGTAAQAQGWGLKNNPGKFAIAGKTGTSRDGWFAGFTPELICVVYVGFDNGDDLGMKGSDSAMPIWADFMKEALGRHPEWTGDWAMPANVRRAEIDIRSGHVVRELDVPETEVEPASIDPEDPYAVPKEIYVTEVPAEFKRVELFVGGTIPNKALLPTGDSEIIYDPETGEPIVMETPTPSPTPLTETWQDGAELPSPEATIRDRGDMRPRVIRSKVVQVCIITGLRATANCPERDARSFREGTEPRDFCHLHR